jgi:hypothetical protein
MQLSKRVWLLPLILVLWAGNSVTAQTLDAKQVNIEGEWKCTGTMVNVPRPTSPSALVIATDADPYGRFYHSGKEFWKIDQNQIIRMEYPCLYVRTSTYKVVNDTFYLDGNKEKYALIQVDSSSLHLTYVKDGVIARKQSFRRTEFDDKVVASLIKDKVNPKCVKGKLYTSRKYSEDGSDEETDDEIQKCFRIKSVEQFKTIQEKQEIVLKFNGEEQVFTVVEIDMESMIGLETKRKRRNDRNLMVITVCTGDWNEGGRLYFYCALQ